MQMTIRESKRRRDSLIHCGLTDAVAARSPPGNRSLHKLLLYYRAHTMGIHLLHKSFFRINVLVHLCVISNLNYQQVKPRNLPSAMLMNGKLSQAKPVSPSPSSGFSVLRAFPIDAIREVMTVFESRGITKKLTEFEGSAKKIQHFVLNYMKQFEMILLFVRSTILQYLQFRMES